MKEKNTEISYEIGSENVFADLDMMDAEEKLAKAKLAFKINQLIEKKRLKQKDAAKLLQIDQSKISLLNRGRLSGFSMERLIKYLSILDQDVEIVVKPHRPRMDTHLRVVFQKA